MKKLFTLFMGLGMVASANAQNPFAYGLSTDGNIVSPSKGVLTVDVNYSLNADAESVNALVKNAEGEVVKTLPLTGTTKGSHTAELDLAGIGHGDFTWAIEVKGGATSGKTTEFTGIRFYHPRGVDVDNNMESPAFGNIYVTEGMVTTSDTYWSGTRGQNGLYIFKPDMTGVKNQVTGNYSFMGGFTVDEKVASGSKTNGADLARVRVAQDGRIFVTRLNDSGAYISVANNAEDLIQNDKFTSLLGDGTVNASDYGFYNNNNEFVAGPNLAFDIKGSGDDLKIVALSAMIKLWSYGSAGSWAHEYELGTASTLPTPSEVSVFHQHLSAAPQCVSVCYDNRGGIWYCQYRGTNTLAKATPDLVYVDANGVEKYRKWDTVRGGGGIRFNSDFSQIAIASSASTFSIYNIEYAEDNTPTLTEVETITHGIGTNLNDIAWDLANNIYICGNSKEYLKGFAVPRANNVFATAAASKYALNIDEATAVGEINTDANAPVEYYNLQGMKVENPANGIFIRKQGSKTTKVVL